MGKVRQDARCKSNRSVNAVATLECHHDLVWAVYHNHNAVPSYKLEYGPSMLSGNGASLQT